MSILPASRRVALLASGLATVSAAAFTAPSAHASATCIRSVDVAIKTNASTRIAKNLSLEARIVLPDGRIVKLRDPRGADRINTANGLAPDSVLRVTMSVPSTVSNGCIPNQAGLRFSIWSAPYQRDESDRWTLANLTVTDADIPTTTYLNTSPYFEFTKYTYAREFITSMNWNFRPQWNDLEYGKQWCDGVSPSTPDPSTTQVGLFVRPEDNGPRSRLRVEYSLDPDFRTGVFTGNYAPAPYDDFTLVVTRLGMVNMSSNNVVFVRAIDETGLTSRKLMIRRCSLRLAA